MWIFIFIKIDLFIKSEIIAPKFCFDNFVKNFHNYFSFILIIISIFYKKIHVLHYPIQNALIFYFFNLKFGADWNFLISYFFSRISKNKKIITYFMRNRHLVEKYNWYMLCASRFYRKTFKYYMLMNAVHLCFCKFTFCENRFLQ